MEEYDLIVIGGGPAGEKGAAKAAFYNKRVALIERSPYLGGAGINTGTIPSKTLRESALYYSGLLQRGLYGIDYSLKENLSVRDFMHRERVVVEHERDQVKRNINRHHIDVYQGEAGLLDSHTVEIRSNEGLKKIAGKVILLATGSSPRHPLDIQFDHKTVYDSDSIIHMDRIPGSMAVVGGGVIGAEYASMFTALGVKVTLVEPRDRIMPFIDSEIVSRLMHQLSDLGMQFMLNDRMQSIATHAGHVVLSLEKGGEWEFDIALIAAGRTSNIEALGLEQVGIKLAERGLVVVNENYQTNVPNIYAAGDVIGFPALASTSMEQARAAMVHAFDLAYKEKLAPYLPLAVYTIPEISAIGVTEDDCKANRTPYLVGRAYYENNPRGQIIGDRSGMLKLTFSPSSKKLLGAHIIGEQASELIHIAEHVMLSGGSIDAFIDAVYNYPTLAEIYEYAAYDGLGKHEKWLASGR